MKISGREVDVDLSNFSILVSRTPPPPTPTPAPPKTADTLDSAESSDVCLRLALVVGGVSDRRRIDCMGRPLGVSRSFEPLELLLLVPVAAAPPSMVFCKRSGKSIVFDLVVVCDELAVVVVVVVVELFERRPRSPPPVDGGLSMLVELVETFIDPLLDDDETGCWGCCCC